MKMIINYEPYRICDLNISKYKNIFNNHFKKYFKINNKYAERLYDIKFNDRDVCIAIRRFSRVFTKEPLSENIIYLVFSMHMIPWEYIMFLKNINFNHISCKNKYELIDFADIRLIYPKVKDASCLLKLSNLITSVHLTKINSPQNRIFSELYEKVAEWGAYLKDVIIKEIYNEFIEDVDNYLSKINMNIK